MNWIVRICLVFCFCVPAVAQTSEITYQGRLVDASLGANGTYEMRFRLFDAETGGTQQPQPTPITLEFTVAGSNPVTVSNGAFTTKLDFTAAAFTGGARFLEISVRRTSTEPFVVLDPRQPITSAPHSIRSLAAENAETAENALSLGGTPAASYVVTTDPRMTNERAPTAGSNDYVQNTTTPQPGVNFNVGGDGTVGGTLTAPTVKVGNSGQLFAPGGEENLRMIRGIVGHNGAIQAGTGFTVQLILFDDKYTILYSTPFPSAPTVNVSAVGRDRRVPLLRETTTALPATHGFSVSLMFGEGTTSGVFHFTVVGPR